jgi:hypothetical protein
LGQKKKKKAASLETPKKTQPNHKKRQKHQKKTPKTSKMPKKSMKLHIKAPPNCVLSSVVLACANTPQKPNNTKKTPKTPKITQKTHQNNPKNVKNTPKNVKKTLKMPKKRQKCPQKRHPTVFCRVWSGPVQTAAPGCAVAVAVSARAGPGRHRSCVCVCVWQWLSGSVWQCVAVGGSGSVAVGGSVWQWLGGSVAAQRQWVTPPPPPKNQKNIRFSSKAEKQTATRAIFTQSPRNHHQNNRRLRLYPTPPHSLCRTLAPRRNDPRHDLPRDPDENLKKKQPKNTP